MAESARRKTTTAQTGRRFGRPILRRLGSAAGNLGDAVALQPDAGHQAALGEGEGVDVAARGGGGE